jgi:hypothetical protein
MEISFLIAKEKDQIPNKAVSNSHKKKINIKTLDKGSLTIVYLQPEN